MTRRSWMILVGLLVLPLLAVVDSTAGDGRNWVFGYALVVSLATYGLYFRDKRAARAGEWRTPEAMLHSFELAGGWPGAFIAQRQHRHKIVKTSYQVMFWLIVLLHQGTAWLVLEWK